MPIERGVDWGKAGRLPAHAPLLSSDQALAEHVAPGSIVAVDRGDMARTLGVRRPYDRSGDKQLLPIDVLQIELDDSRRFVCIAHTVVGRLLVSRHTVAVMNAAFIGEHNVGPRAHPGDGKVDVVTFDLAPVDRFKAHRRLRSGTHVPHPDIDVRRVASGVLNFERRRQIRVDGRLVGRSRTVRFAVQPAAITIAV